jgi:hypothetical protein
VCGAERCMVLETVHHSESVRIMDHSETIVDRGVGMERMAYRCRSITFPLIDNSLSPNRSNDLTYLIFLLVIGEVTE